MNAKNSEHSLSIEKFLVKQEEVFFGKLRKDKLSSAASILSSRRDSFTGSLSPSTYSRAECERSKHEAPVSRLTAFAAAGFDHDMPLTNPNPQALQMSGVQIALARQIGGWPIYTIIIALGQMLSATAFQITLLTGRNRQEDIQFYVLGIVFLAASGTWYPLFRAKPSVYVLSAPWMFFGLAFLMIGLPSVHSSIQPAHRVLSNIATGSYAIASAAAFSFFGLNFGEEAVSIGCFIDVYLLISQRVLRLRCGP